MLNAYPDSIGGQLSDIVDFLGHPALEGVFESFYILPSLFHTDLDRGFSVLDYGLNRRLATEADLKALQAHGVDLKLDFILNHASVLSPQFQDIVAHGEQSPYRDFFIDWNRFWAGHGTMTATVTFSLKPRSLRTCFSGSRACRFCRCASPMVAPYRIGTLFIRKFATPCLVSRS